MIATPQSPEHVATERFEFGKNWSKYAATITAEDIQSAIDSLRSKLEVDTLEGCSFIDVGSGSGLFSLAAHRLGARVLSFDFDADSVATSDALRHAYSRGEAWQVEQGSILDDDYVDQLRQFDVVYSWGVLHHTGSMWAALANTTRLVKPGGKLFISIYNDQGKYSRYWHRIKTLYNALPRFLRFLVLVPCFIRMRGPMIVRDLMHGDPTRSWRNYRKEQRGMSPWYDVVDWVGGLPFEVAKPEDILHFYRTRGFTLTRLKTCGGGKGCNEYVFLRIAPVK